MNAIPPLLKGLSDIIDDYDHFIIDVWGVLHDGRKAYPGAAAAMQFLKDRGKQTLLLSNSPNRSARVLEKVIKPIGIPDGTYDHILTSGEAAHHHMLAHHSGQRVYCFWDEENPTAIENIDLTRVYKIEDADFIYGSILPYQSSLNDYVDVMAQALMRKLPFVCGNPDRVVGVDDALHICAGQLAEWYENAGGDVTWIGKPYRPIYDQAWEMLGQPDKSRIVAIGDSLITDIAGAAGFGCDALWNVTGIHWDEVQTGQSINSAKLIKALNNHPKPVGLLHGFQA